MFYNYIKRSLIICFNYMIQIVNLSSILDFNKQTPFKVQSTLFTLTIIRYLSLYVVLN